MIRFNYLGSVAVYHAAAIIKLIIKSTTAFESPLNTRRTPLATPAMIPVGPLILSIHPGRGSFKAAVTIEGLTIAVETFPLSSSNSFSAIALVKVYVLGHFPTSLNHSKTSKKQK